MPSNIVKFAIKSMNIFCVPYKTSNLGKIEFSLQTLSKNVILTNTSKKLKLKQVLYSSKMYVLTYI